MIDKEEFDWLVDEMVEELRDLPNKSIFTIGDLLKSTYDYIDERDIDMFDLYEKVFKIAKENRMRIRCADKIIKDDEGNICPTGTPYNLKYRIYNLDAQYKCPYCGSTNTAKILYGMPAFSLELQDKIKRGKIVLGGCCVADNDPDRQCNDCEKEFCL